VQGELARSPSVGIRGKDHVIEPVRRLGPLGSSLEVLLGDDLEGCCCGFTLLHRCTTFTWSLLGLKPIEEWDVHRCKLSTLKASACSTMSRSGAVSTLAMGSWMAW
jgi:hypothetical protein